ncbi:nose resistant to fluoxetine protein 6 [Galendromus occidentalis]|uniref:Nose resistant to fluoxetine protein 6 n=1 Tax=Galendromus occidentalis TaxID=34638 RepID=A0AAJ6QXL0_9ACAR|nr:nose resistant to fluoxetine protein 6 [Galendromus occidentalis]
MQLYWVFSLVGLLGYTALGVSAQEASEFGDDASGGQTKQQAQDEERYPTTTEVQSTTRDLLDDLEPIFKDIQRKVYPAVSELLADENISSECTTSILATLNGVRNQKKWALMIATASGTIPQNLFLGAQGSHGSYDQCLAAKRTNHNGEIDLRGQYCTLLLYPTQKMFESLKEFMKDDPFFKQTFNKMAEWPREYFGIATGIKIGVCTPDHCSDDDLNYAIDKLFNRVYGIETRFVSCRIREAKVPTTFQRIVIASGFVLLALVLLGTATDFYLNRVRDEPQYISPWLIITFVMMYSARRNVRRLFTPYTPQTKELGFLNGIKVLLSCWVVYGHNAIFVSPDILLNITDYVELLKNVPFQIITNSFMAVSSFFFISGFLLAYLCFKEKKRIVKQNPALLISIMFVRRYFRLVIPLLVVVCYSLLMDLWADGPNDRDSIFNLYARSCPRNWWSIPTLTSNYMGADNMCLGHSWYVAVDMQVFVLAAILVMLILFHPRAGIFLTTALILITSAWVALSTYLYGYSPIISFTGSLPEVLAATFDYVYAQPVTHAGCYLLGILCAYVCFYKGTKLEWYTQTAMWILAHGCSSYVVFVTVFWYRHGMPGPLGGSLYAGFHRVTFTLGLFWLIYACLHGMAPYTRRILEHSAFRALGRLAFGIYLVHFAVVFMHQGLLKNQAFYPDQFLLLQSTLGILGISVGLAFLMNIAVESPVAHMDNFLFKKVMGKLIGEPQNAKEAEMIGRKAEVALTLEQHYDHWRRTSSKKDRDCNGLSDRNGTIIDIKEQLPTKVLSDKTRL